MQVTQATMCIGHSSFSIQNKGKTTERWWRKVTGLKGLTPKVAGLLESIRIRAVQAGAGSAQGHWRQRLPTTRLAHSQGRFDGT